MQTINKHVAEAYLEELRRQAKNSNQFAAIRKEPSVQIPKMTAPKSIEISFTIKIQKT